MTQKQIYLCYKGNAWLNYSSLVLCYIGENKEDCIAQLQAHRGMTDEQAEQVREKNQSQCNNLDYEWFFEQVLTNAFCD